MHDPTPLLGLLTTYIDLAGKKVDKTSELEDGTFQSFNDYKFQSPSTHTFQIDLMFLQDKLRNMNFDRAISWLGNKGYA